MSLLRKSESSSRQKSLLIITAISLFATLCMTVAVFALGVGAHKVSAQQSKSQESAQNNEQEERARKERQGKKEEGAGERLDQPKLAREAKITMAQALQTALNHQPGTVLEARLAREKGENSEVTFKVLILDSDRTDGKVSFVIVSGLDGRVIKTEGAYIK